jgi:exonuclease VII large subunit
MDYAVPILVAAIAAAASVAAAWISSRTRRENASQHGESQRLLVNLADKVDGHGQKLDQVADRVESVAARVDHAHSRIDNHKRRWFR